MLPTHTAVSVHHFGASFDDTILLDLRKLQSVFVLPFVERFLWRSRAMNNTVKAVLEFKRCGRTKVP